MADKPHISRCPSVSLADITDCATSPIVLCNCLAWANSSIVTLLFCCHVVVLLRHCALAQCPALAPAPDVSLVISFAIIVSLKIGATTKNKLYEIHVIPFRNNGIFEDMAEDFF